MNKAIQIAELVRLQVPRRAKTHTFQESIEGNMMKVVSSDTSRSKSDRKIWWKADWTMAAKRAQR
jgi:hypothetical protein